MAYQIDLPFDDSEDDLDQKLRNHPDNFDEALRNSPLQGRDIRFGKKIIDFPSEIEKAMYVLASQPSGILVREKEIMEYLNQFGIGEKEVRQIGKKLVASTKYQAKQSEDRVDISSDYYGSDQLSETIKASKSGFLFGSNEEIEDSLRRMKAKEALREELLKPFKPEDSFISPELFEQLQSSPPPSAVGSDDDSGQRGRGFGGGLDFITNPEDEKPPKIYRSHIKQRANSLQAQVLASLRRELGKDLEASRARSSEISGQASKARAAGYSIGGLFGFPGYAFSTVLDSLTVRPEEDRLKGVEASYQGARKDEFADQAFKIKEFMRQYIFDAVDRVNDEMLQGVEDALKDLEGKSREEIFEGISALAKGLADEGLLDERVKNQGTGDIEGLDPSQFRKSQAPNALGTGGGDGADGNNAKAPNPFGAAGNLAKFTGVGIAAYGAFQAARTFTNVVGGAISSVGENLNASSTIQGQQGLIKNTIAASDVTSLLGINPITKAITTMFDVVSQIEENTRKEAPFATPDTLVADAVNQMAMIQRMLVEGAERDPVLAELTRIRGALSREAEGLKTELLKTFGPLLADTLQVIAVNIKIVTDVLSTPGGKSFLRWLMGGGGNIGAAIAAWGLWADARMLKEAMEANIGLVKDMEDFLADDYALNPSNKRNDLDAKMNAIIR